MDDRKSKLESARAKLKKFQQKKTGNSTGSSSCKSQRSSSICSSDILPLSTISNSSDKDFKKLNDNEMRSANGHNLSRVETPTVSQNEMSSLIDPYFTNTQQYIANLSNASLDDTDVTIHGTYGEHHFTGEVPQNQTVPRGQPVESPTLISHDNESLYNTVDQINDISRQVWMSPETLSRSVIDVSHESCRNIDLQWRQEYARLEAELLDKQSNMEILMQQKEDITRRCIFLETELQKNLEQMLRNPAPSSNTPSNTQFEASSCVSLTQNAESPSVHNTEPCQSCDIKEKQIQELSNKLIEMEQLDETKNRLIQVLQEDNRVLNRALAQNAHLRSQLDELQVKVKSQTATHSNTLPQESLEDNDLPSSEKLLSQKKDYESLETEFQDLQRRFMSLQDHCTVLEASNSKLEREVLQLDGETHTIGEYVLLYREQRDRLRNRASHLQYLTSELSRIKDCFRDKFHFLEQLVRQESSSHSNDSESSARGNLLSHIMEIVEELDQLESNWPRWTESDFTSPEFAKFGSYNIEPVFQYPSSGLVSHSNAHNGICDIPSCKCCTGQLVNL